MSFMWLSARSDAVLDDRSQWDARFYRRHPNVITVNLMSSPSLALLSSQQPAGVSYKAFVFLFNDCFHAANKVRRKPVTH